MRSKGQDTTFTSQGRQHMKIQNEDPWTKIIWSESGPNLASPGPFNLKSL